MKRCTKGKSCGATCIDRRERCVLELGPIISKSVHNVREKLGVMALWRQVQAQGKGGGAKFNKIKKQVEVERAQGRALRKQADLIEFRNRLQKEGLLPKSKKSEEGLGGIFARQIAAGKKAKTGRPEFTPLPSDLRRQLFALPNAAANPAAPVKKEQEPVRQLSKSPGGARMRPPGEAPAKKGETDLIMDDISRMMRGESPRNIQVASAPGELGMKGRIKPETSGPGSATGNTKWARLDAKDQDSALGSVTRFGSKSYDGWKDSYGSGATKIGEGSYGTVIRNPDGTFVKRGAISNQEAILIKRLGEADLGPKLVAADVNGFHPNHKERFVDIRNGRIAMGQVPGKPMGYAKPDDKFGGKNAADIYWKSMADLHRKGIAHNDAHIDNILIDNKGKGRWVDLGLAQASPKAALAEAMGVFNTLRGAEATRVLGAGGAGNWQARRWDGTGVSEAEKARNAGGAEWAKFQQRFPVASQVWENRGAAQYKLMNMGLSRNDVSTIIDHGIRSPMDTYTKGPWAKLTDAQAQEVLNTLYDGI